MFSEGWRTEKNEEEKRSDGRFQHPRIVRALSQDTTHLGSREAKKVRPLWGGGGVGRDAAAIFFETHPVARGVGGQWHHCLNPYNFLFSCPVPPSLRAGTVFILPLPTMGSTCLCFVAFCILGTGEMGNTGNPYHKCSRSWLKRLPLRLLQEDPS